MSDEWEKVRAARGVPTTGGSGTWGNPFGVVVVLIEIWSETCYGERFDRSQNEAIDIVNVLGNISK